MSAKSWFVTDDGNFEIISLSAETLEGGLNVMRNAFFKDENVAIACEVDKNEGARKELEELCVRAARDGISLVAIERATGKVVAASFNKMQIKGNPEDSDFFEMFRDNCKHDESKALVQFMYEADSKCNIYDYYKVDCLLELMFLATLSEYRGQGLGKKLCEVSIELGKKLLKGECVKVAIDEKYPVTDEPKPKVVSAIFTSFITQLIGKSLNFDKLVEISYKEFSYKGHTYFSKIGQHTPTTTLEAFSLMNKKV